jgi:hypothetical protein
MKDSNFSKVIVWRNKVYFLSVFLPFVACGGSGKKENPVPVNPPIGGTVTVPAGKTNDGVANTKEETQHIQECTKLLSAAHAKGQAKNNFYSLGYALNEAFEVAEGDDKQLLKLVPLKFEELEIEMANKKKLVCSYPTEIEIRTLSRKIELVDEKDRFFESDLWSKLRNGFPADSTQWVGTAIVGGVSRWANTAGPEYFFNNQLKLDWKLQYADITQLKKRLIEIGIGVTDAVKLQNDQCNIESVQIQSVKKENSIWGIQGRVTIASKKYCLEDRSAESDSEIIPEKLPIGWLHPLSSDLYEPIQCGRGGGVLEDSCVRRMMESFDPLLATAIEYKEPFTVRLVVSGITEEEDVLQTVTIEPDGKFSNQSATLLTDANRKTLGVYPRGTVEKIQKRFGN